MASPCVNCSLAPTHLCQGWTVKYCFTSLEHDLTKNKTQPISFGGTYSTNCTTMNKILAFMIDRSTPWSCDMRQGSNYGTDRQKGNTFTFDSHCTWAWLQHFGNIYSWDSLWDAKWILLMTGLHSYHNLCPGLLWNFLKAIILSHELFYIADLHHYSLYPRSICKTIWTNSWDWFLLKKNCTSR